MGAIFAATHVNLNRTVAVKLIRTDLLSQPTSVARFKREARMAAQVEHPHAVTVYDFGSLDGIGAYLAMEFVRGESLRSMLKRRGPLPLADAVEIASQVASVLGAAHRHGIVHRDVKPANILIRSDAGRLAVKLTDFGIAKSVAVEETTQLTSPSELVGTPSYMSPEQFSGDPIDGRADLYALAVVVYEMLSGHCPFEGTLSEVIGKHLFTEPPALPDEGETDAFSAFLRRALAKAPADRPATAAEFISELNEAASKRAEVTGEPIELSEQTLEIEAPVAETERVPIAEVRDNSYATSPESSTPAHGESTAFLPTVFVPAPATHRVTALAGAETTRPRANIGRRAMAAAAGVALAALFIASSDTGATDNPAAPAAQAVASGQASTVPVRESAARSAPDDPEPAKAVEKQEPRATRPAPSKRKSTPRTSKPRKSGNRVVRVLRVDRQIVKIFRG
jgi:serine/threonine-protein kinase